MKYASVVLFCCFTAFAAHAKVWRINNTPGVNADFSSCQLAVDAPAVQNGDTLHVEGSAITYPGFTLTKRLVIIGTGYFLSGTNANTGLQANTNSSNFGTGYIIFDSTSSGSTFIGLDNVSFGIGPNQGSATDNFTINRCRVYSLAQYYGSLPNTIMAGWKINKCYFSGGGITLSGANDVLQNWEITNNIFENGSFSISSPGNLNNLVRNNIFRGQVQTYSAYIANNIITGTTFNAVNTTVKNNLSTGNNLPAGNGNLNNQTDANLFEGLTGNSTDGQWRLKAGSNAIGAGETVGGITPDCGAYGTADPYRLSGIPPIPTIYALTVPASVSSSATSMPITISTKSNN